MKGLFGKIINYIWMACLKFSARLPLSKEPTLFQGDGSLIELVNFIAKRGKKRVFLVTTASVVKRGQIDQALEAFKSQQIDVVVFDDIQPDPTNQKANEALDILNQNKCDSVLAVGGGSAIDLAKVVALAAANNKRPESLAGYFRALRKPLPIFVAPTTAGTGSEVTVVSVISDTVTHKKYFVIDPRTVSVATALDPELTKTLPPFLTATTGMDALTHAVEAYIGRNGCKYTDQQSSEAIQLIFKYLPIAVKDGGNNEARTAMALASYKAGLSFTKASLGYVHAFSHQLTAHYGVAHGLANSILLPHVIKFNQQTVTNKLAKLAVLVGLGNDQEAPSVLAQKFADQLFSLSKVLDIPETVEELKPEDIPSITDDALKEAIFNYPVPKFMTSSEGMSLLKSVAPSSNT